MKSEKLELINSDSAFSPSKRRLGFAVDTFFLRPVLVRRRAFTRHHISPSSSFFRFSSLNTTDYNHFVISAGYYQSFSSSGKAFCLLERTISFTFFFCYFYFISVLKTWRLRLRNPVSVFFLFWLVIVYEIELFRNKNRFTFMVLIVVCGWVDCGLYVLFWVIFCFGIGFACIFECLVD